MRHSKWPDDLFKQTGYDTISFYQLEGYLNNKINLPAKVVVLTFDDGLKSVQRYAYPILKENGFPEPRRLLFHLELSGTHKMESWLITVYAVLLSWKRFRMYLIFNLIHIFYIGQIISVTLNFIESFLSQYCFWFWAFTPCVIAI